MLASVSTGRVPGVTLSTKAPALTFGACDIETVRKAVEASDNGEPNPLFVHYTREEEDQPTLRECTIHGKFGPFGKNLLLGERLKNFKEMFPGENFSTMKDDEGAFLYGLGYKYADVPDFGITSGAVLVQGPIVYGIRLKDEGIPNTAESESAKSATPEGLYTQRTLDVEG